MAHQGEATPITQSKEVQMFSRSRGLAHPARRAPQRRLLGGALTALFLSACEPFANAQEFTTDAALLMRASALKPVSVEPAESAAEGAAGGVALRVMAWNIKYGAGRLPFWFDCWGDRTVMTSAEVSQNMEALYAMIREANPDVLMIEEVEVNSRRSAYFNMVQGILENTDLNYAAYFNTWDSRYIPSEGLGRMDLGNAILSRHEIKEATRIRQQDRTDLDLVTEPFYIKRAIGRAVLKVGGGEVAAFVVHTEAYDEDGTKAAQIAQIKEVLDAEALPYVIGGDFNELPPTAARLEGFPDERETALCSDEFSQPPYTPEVMSPYFNDLSPWLPLERFGTTEAEQARLFTHTVLGPDEVNEGGEAGDWNRTLDYLFASPGAVWREGASDVLQRAGQRVGVLREGDADTQGWALTSNPLDLSDHAPVFGIVEVKP